MFRSKETVALRSSFRFKGVESTLNYLYSLFLVCVVIIVFLIVFGFVFVKLTQSIDCVIEYRGLSTSLLYAERKKKDTAFGILIGWLL